MTKLSILCNLIKESSSGKQFKKRWIGNGMMLKKVVTLDTLKNKSRIVKNSN